MGKAPALLWGRGSAKGRLSESAASASASSGCQHHRGRLGDAADGGHGEERQHEIDVVGGADEDPVALSEALGDEPTGEPAHHAVELGMQVHERNA